MIDSGAAGITFRQRAWLINYSQCPLCEIAWLKLLMHCWCAPALLPVFCCWRWLPLSATVITRYLLNVSSIGLEELGWHFYAAMFLLAIPYAAHTGSHVRIDLIYEGRSEKYKRFIGLVGTLVFMFPFALITLYYGWEFAAQAVSYGPPAESVSALWEQFLTTGIGEKSQDPGGLNNRFIIKAVIPLSAFLLFLAGVSKILKGEH